MSNRVVIVFISSLLITLAVFTAQTSAQEPGDSHGIPKFALIPATPIELPAAVDSNSPAFWQFEQGQNRLHVLTSWENPSISQGVSLQRLRRPQAVRFSNSVNGGRWMEAVLQDEYGTLYGYYHNEPLGLCGAAGKTAPRIGAARSRDNGLSWEDLGIILEASASPLDCGTPNQFFVGGFGDLTVALDQSKTDVYIFFTNYSGPLSRQGVAVARTSWAQRDTPQGNVTVWDDHTWRYPRTGRQFRRDASEPGPIYPASVSWHDRSGTVDSYWGPSVHWNTSLQQYVMLLNRASDSAWTQEGVYIAFSPVLDDPARWTQPVKIIDGGTWYPQVIGLERDAGTDKLAGSIARLFMSGRSDYFLVFRGNN